MLKNASIKRAVIMAAALAGVVLVGEVIAAVGERHQRVHGLPVPAPFLIQALEFGTATALFAVGLVLIYRATRIINFAHNGFGAVAGTLFFELTFVEHWPYVIALLLSLGAGVACGAAVELLFIRRFARGSRLVLTVVTLGVGQLLAAIAQAIPGLIQRDTTLLTGIPTTPFSDFKWHLFPIVLSGNDLVMLIVAGVLLGSFAVFLQRSRAGVAIRGAAENEDRAALLGINTGRLSLIVWTLAAALSTAAAVFQMPIQGYVPGAAVGAVGSGMLLRALAAAVIGGMENLPITVTASIGIAVFERSVFAGYKETSIVDLLLLIVIVGVLLIQRRKLARTDEGSTQAWAATEEIRAVPKELAGVDVVRSATRWVVAIAAVILLGLPWIMSNGQVNSAALFPIYASVI